LLKVKFLRFQTWTPCS